MMRTKPIMNHYDNIKQHVTAMATAITMLTATGNLYAQSAHDSIPPTDDAEKTDTLREVVVRPDTTLHVVEAVKKSLNKNRQPKTKSFGDVLEKISPGINDKITHPFAVKDRRREKKHKRDRSILDAYDRSKTPNELLEEALRREGLGHIIDQHRK